MIIRPPAPPQLGQVVRLRSRQYLVEAVVAAPNPGDQTLVRNSCPGVLADSSALATSLRLQFDTLVETGALRRLPLAGRGATE